MWSHGGERLSHILFGERVSAARHLPFYPIRNAHGWIQMFYSLANIHKICVFEQVNRNYSSASWLLHPLRGVVPTGDTVSPSSGYSESFRTHSSGVRVPLEGIPSSNTSDATGPLVWTPMSTRQQKRGWPKSIWLLTWTPKVRQKTFGVLLWNTSMNSCCITCI